MSELKLANKWFGLLSLEHKAKIIGDNVESFDPFEGYSEADNYYYYKWQSYGEITKVSLYNYFK